MIAMAMIQGAVPATGSGQAVGSGIDNNKRAFSLTQLSLISYQDNNTGVCRREYPTLQTVN